MKRHTDGKPADSNPGPRTRSQEVGDFGERLFTYALPSSWVIHHYKGTEDYGLDFHVEIFDSGKATGLEFGAQVKTTASGRSKKVTPTVVLSRSNLVYLARKPYPSMLVYAWESEKQAIFCWLHEAVSAFDLANCVFDGQESNGGLSIKVKPSYDLAGSSKRIQKVLSRHRAFLVSWMQHTSNLRQILDLYLDLHAALDAVVECVAFIHRPVRWPDETTHKSTFTLILIVMAYGRLHEATSPAWIRLFGPVGTLAIALREDLRSSLELVFSREDLATYVTSLQNVHLMKAKTTDVYPLFPPLMAVLRDIVRAFGRVLAPWRDVKMRVSGLASSVIDYRHQVVAGKE